MIHPSTVFLEGLMKTQQTPCFILCAFGLSLSLVTYFHLIIITIIIIIFWGANHPYTQLRAELRRLWQLVQEAGMQGRLWLPATSTHYDHGAQPENECASQGRKIRWSGKPLWHSRKLTHNSTHICPWPLIEPWWEASALRTCQPSPQIYFYFYSPNYFTHLQ